MKLYDIGIKIASLFVTLYIGLCWFFVENKSECSDTRQTP